MRSIPVIISNIMTVHERRFGLAAWKTNKKKIKKQSMERFVSGAEVCAVYFLHVCDLCVCMSGLWSAFKMCKNLADLL